MNTFFKSKGKIVPKKEALEAYKELAERYLSGNTPKRVNSAALKEQTERLEMIIKALENFK